MDLALDLCDEIVLLHRGELEAVEKSHLDNQEFKDKIITALSDEGSAADAPLREGAGDTIAGVGSPAAPAGDLKTKAGEPNGKPGEPDANAADPTASAGARPEISEASPEEVTHE